MVKNRRANAVLFGFDFQRNAAIILMLERIKELRSVRLEGNEEDIELTLENGKKILAQAKAVEKSSSDFSHVRENLKKALISLSEGAQRVDAQELIFITNSPNPFNDEASRSVFGGLPTHRSFSSLPPSAQVTVQKYLGNIEHPLDSEKFTVQVFPFETDNEAERYKAVTQAMNDFIGSLNVNVSYGLGINSNHTVSLGNTVIISNDDVVAAINFCNHALRTLDEQTKQFDINIFEAMGMRNLSGIVGEYFAKSIQRFSHDSLHSNLHQDGYPDLLLTHTQEQKNYFSTLYTVVNGKKYPRDKSLFSPYLYGGLEVKATCGSTPPASRVPKPLIGEQRIALVNSFDWKAHHRETNNLLGIFWDFLNEVPTIVACFYRNDLVIDDWGRIVQPTDGGGRTTSVSIMAKTGIKKMCDGWIAVIDRPEYIDAFSRSKWIGYSVK